jgi:hypothetical protein
MSFSGQDAHILPWPIAVIAGPLRKESQRSDCHIFDVVIGGWQARSTGASEAVAKRPCAQTQVFGTGT